MDCHLNPFSRSLPRRAEKKFLPVIYCFVKRKHRKIVKRLKKLLAFEKEWKLEMQTWMKWMFYPEPIHGSEINCSAERNVPMAQDIFQTSSRAKTYRIYQPHCWSLISEESWENVTNRLLMDVRDLRRSGKGSRFFVASSIRHHRHHCIAVHAALNVGCLCKIPKSFESFRDL